MYNKELSDFKNLPVDENKRVWTDCLCTILSALFALTLFILSFLLFQSANYQRVNFPVDDAGTVCKLDTPNYPLIYFSSVTDITSGRVCVSQCPAVGQLLSCNGCVKTALYSTQVVVNRMGGYCQPVDDGLNDKLEANPQFTNKLSLMNGYTAIILAVILGVVLGLFYLSVQMCCPQQVGAWVFVAASFVLVGLAVYLFVGPLNTSINVPLAVTLVIVALLLVIYFVVYRREIDLGALFLHHAAICLRENSFAFWVLPVFTICGFGLLVLCIWQFVAFGAGNASAYTAGDLYLHSAPNMFLEILNLIEFVWGVQFLKDACKCMSIVVNFVVSGYAVDWYFKSNAQAQPRCGKPCRLLMSRHWGSVVGGSFLNAFFHLPALIYDLFRCDPKGSCGCCQSCYRTVCCCDSLFELVRTDAYAYINLTGVAYCDAARQCEALCAYSDLYYSRQSCMRLYRFAANVLLLGLILLIVSLLLGWKVGSTIALIILLIIFTAYVMISPFVEIIPATADGLHISYLLEDNYSGMEGMRVCPQSLRYDVDNFKVKHNAL